MHEAHRESEVAQSSIRIDADDWAVVSVSVQKGAKSTIYTGTNPSHDVDLDF